MTGALIACVSGTPARIGPMIAIVWSIAAIEAAQPVRRPVFCAVRASATPPARASAKPALGAAREARNEAVATCARPEGGFASSLSVPGAPVMNVTKHHQIAAVRGNDLPISAP